jgi:hypothetical protein
MSARDSESGSSNYKGGSGNAGGLGNGGVGGGMGGGHRGGGAGYNGGIGSRTGMTTGKDWYGNSAFGRAGGNVAAYGMRDARSLKGAGLAPTMGNFGNFRTPSGRAMFGGSPVQGQSFQGRNMGQALSQGMRAQAAYEAANRPQVGGLLGPARGPAPEAPYEENILAIEDVPAVPNVFNQSYLTNLADFRKAMNAKYGWGNAMPGPGPMPAPSAPSGPWPGQGVNSLARDPNELSNYNWDGDSVPLRGVAGGQGIKSWDTIGAATPSSRGWGGWNTPWN